MDVGDVERSGGYSLYNRKNSDDVNDLSEPHAMNTLINGHHFSEAEVLGREASDVEIIDSLTAAFRDKIAKLVIGVIGDDVIPAHPRLTQFDLRLEYDDGKHVEWVTDEGRVFVTRSDKDGFAEPTVPSAPDAVTELLNDQSVDALLKARDAINKMITGFFALRETGVVCDRAPRSFNPVENHQYSGDHEMQELQKYAKAHGSATCK